jgi:peptide/nickel transport system substrate-binding protein
MNAKLRPTKRMLRRRADRAERLAKGHLHKFLVARWDNLREARRGVISWLLLIAVFIALCVAQTMSYSRGYRTDSPAAGGVYVEGVVGNIANLNPLYAETDNEKAVSSLIYSGLFRYDGNQLQGDLASRWTAGEDGRTYEITVRDNARFQDGQPLTADDVIFTTQLIQNPAVNSPLYASWRNIKVEKIAANQVRFELATPYVSFLYALTFGILPQHALTNIEPASLREFVTSNQVIGSGAFGLREIQATVGGQSVIQLAANNEYFRRPARLSFMQIRTYGDEAALVNGFQRKEIAAAAGLSPTGAAQLLTDNDEAKLTQAPLDDGVFALLNTDVPALTDLRVREALRFGTNLADVRRAAAPDSVTPPSVLNGPLIKGLFASVDKQTQPEFDAVAAAAKLTEAGYTQNPNGQWQKDGQPLRLNVVTVAGASYAPAAENLATQWKKLGIAVELTMAEPNSAQQNYFIPRNYDVLIYQLHLGADPDVFAYWHSSQATARGLNFANYRSLLADAALTGGRARTSYQLRDAKYQTFVETWLADVPALALYQPDYYYVSLDNVRALAPQPLPSAADRFADADQWTVNWREVEITP